MNIIDKLKKLFFGISEKEKEQTNDDVTTTKSDLSPKTPIMSNKMAQIHNRFNSLMSDIINNHDDLLANLIDDDLAEMPMPCVYGPPSWYENGRLDNRIPRVQEYMNECDKIEKRNRIRIELRTIINDSIDEPIAKMHGPIPNI